MDDEKNIRLTLAHALEACGLPVATAVNEEDALQRLQEIDVAVMLPDLLMPGMNGMEVLRRIARERPELPVVVLTARVLWKGVTSNR